MTNTPRVEDIHYRWPFVSMWENYLEDANASPIRFGKKTCESVFQLIFGLLFLLLVVVNVLLMVKEFNWIYLASSIMTWIAGPVLVRLNITKLAGKEKFEKHKRLRRIFIILLVVQVGLFVLFMAFIIFALLTTPKLAPPFRTNAIYRDPISMNSSRLPSMCTTSFGGKLMIQYAGLTQIPADDLAGPDVRDKKMELLFGQNWRESFGNVTTKQTKQAVFSHIVDRVNEMDLVIVRETTTKADSLMQYSISGLYRIPEMIFSTIPLSQIIYGGLLQLMIGAFSVPASVYTPSPLIDAYYPPIHDFVKGLGNREVVLLGSTLGGGLSKITGMHLQHKAVSINGPEVRLWYIQDYSQQSLKMSFARNLLIDGQSWTGSEVGSLTDYIPYDKFPVNPASSAVALCTMAIECQVFDRFAEYCNQTVGRKIIDKIHAHSPYV